MDAASASTPAGRASVGDGDDTRGCVQQVDGQLGGVVDVDPRFGWGRSLVVGPGTVEMADTSPWSLRSSPLGWEHDVHRATSGARPCPVTADR